MDNQENENGQNEENLAEVIETEPEEEPVKESGERVILTDEKYTAKGFLKSSFLGFAIGLAIIVPGISGAAVAILMKLYDKLIYSVSHIFSDFKKCIRFLFPILVGGVVGFIIGFFLVKLLLEIIPFSIIGLFAGLMIGALPTVTSELKGDKPTFSKGCFTALGILIPLAVAIVAVVLSSDSISYSYGITVGEEDSSSISVAVEKFGDIAWWQYVIALPMGMIVGLTQVIPGLSATAFLMMFGYYRPIVASISLTYWTQYPQIFGFYVVFAVGFLLGFWITSKIMDRLFAWNRLACYRVIVGMSIGSVIGMFVNPDVFGIYYSWGLGFNIEQSTQMIVDIALFVPLLVVGFLISFLLVRNSSKKQQAVN